MSSGPPAPVLNELQPGEQVGRYQLLYPMARGGMGTVWLARARGAHGFEKHFVVKTVRPELAQDTSLRTMFLDEVRISAAISHPNVAQVVDAGEAREMPYLVMEYVQGESLSRLQRVARQRSGQRLPPAIAVRMVVGACAGLHAAHELASPNGALLNVVHRDVSPQNILVSLHGTTKVIDFGIATARERLAAETSLGVVKGKLRYMAPEQIARRDLDRRADIWSLGCILHLLLTGADAFAEPNEAALIHQILGHQRPLVLDGLPSSLARVVDACLDPSPEGRPPTADELGRILEKALRDERLVASESDVGREFASIFREREATAGSAMKTALAAIAERERIRVLLEPQAEITSPQAERIRRPVEPPVEDVTHLTAMAPPAEETTTPQEATAHTARGVSKRVQTASGLPALRARLGLSLLILAGLGMLAAGTWQLVRPHAPTRAAYASAPEAPARALARGGKVSVDEPPPLPSVMLPDASASPVAPVAQPTRPRTETPPGRARPARPVGGDLERRY